MLDIGVAISLEFSDKRLLYPDSLQLLFLLRVFNAAWVCSLLLFISFTGIPLLPEVVSLRSSAHVQQFHPHSILSQDLDHLLLSIHFGPSSRSARSLAASCLLVKELIDEGNLVSGCTRLGACPRPQYIFFRITILVLKKSLIGLCTQLVVRKLS
jgi:hypothetical protein